MQCSNQTKTTDFNPCLFTSWRFDFEKGSRILSTQTELPNLSWIIFYNKQYKSILWKWGAEFLLLRIYVWGMKLTYNTGFYVYYTSILRPNPRLSKFLKLKIVGSKKFHNCILLEGNFDSTKCPHSIGADKNKNVNSNFQLFYKALWLIFSGQQLYGDCSSFGQQNYGHRKNIEMQDPCY